MSDQFNTPQQPSYQPPAYAAAGVAGVAKFNVLAIVAFIGAFIIPLVGIIVGFIARGQIRRTGERGGALALWGIILGFVFIALWILIVIISVIASVALNSQGY